LQGAYAQQSAAAASQGLAVQTEADQASIAQAKIDATKQVAIGQNQVALTNAVGNNILAFGNTIASTIAAQSLLPATAMQAAAAADQTALAGAAAVASQGVASQAGSITAAAHLLGVQTGNFGTTLIGFGQNIAAETSSAVNAVAVASGSSSSAAAGSASNSANANSRTAVEGEKAAAQIFGGMMF
jgi:hypothetical protein